MIDSPKCGRIAEAIRALLRAGIELGTDVRHTIASTLGDSRPQALAAALADPQGCENAPLLELILFPDERFQVALEPRLAAEDPDRKSVV